MWLISMHLNLISPLRRLFVSNSIMSGNKFELQDSWILMWLSGFGNSGIEFLVSLWSSLSSSRFQYLPISFNGNAIRQPTFSRGDWKVAINTFQISEILVQHCPLFSHMKRRKQETRHSVRSPSFDCIPQCLLFNVIKIINWINTVKGRDPPVSPSLTSSSSVTIFPHICSWFANGANIVTNTTSTSLWHKVLFPIIVFQPATTNCLGHPPTCLSSRDCG